MAGRAMDGDFSPDFQSEFVRVTEEGEEHPVGLGALAFVQTLSDGNQSLQLWGWSAKARSLSWESV